MHLSKSDAQRRLDLGTLPIAITGLPNVGKSQRGQHLAKIGYEHVECDVEIAERLSDEFGVGLQSVDDVAQWMGKRYEPGAEYRQAQYVYHEAVVLRELLSRLETQPANVAVDTTGSIVHVGAFTCRRLQSAALVVYIRASRELREELVRRFLEHPKPVILGSLWRPYPGEEPEDALNRCFRELISWREVEYPRFADVTLPMKEIPMDMSGSDFLELVLSRL